MKSKIFSAALAGALVLGVAPAAQALEEDYYKVQVTKAADGVDSG
ncbi:MAG: hypothetical protein Q4A31_09670 [Corynebacterium sp.]|nr:hypothetical protein [Corynebacterium sp.]MDO4762173.1 hypothetical protein [Corynebacterium sp.]